MWSRGGTLDDFNSLSIFTLNLTFNWVKSSVAFLSLKPELQRGQPQFLTCVSRVSLDTTALSVLRAPLFVSMYAHFVTDNASHWAALRGMEQVAIIQSSPQAPSQTAHHIDTHCATDTNAFATHWHTGSGINLSSHVCAISRTDTCIASQRRCVFWLRPKIHTHSSSQFPSECSWTTG